MLDDEAPTIIGLLEVLHTTLATMFFKGINKLFQFYWKNVDDFYVVQNRFIYGFSIPRFCSSLIQEFFT
jgi:hypothetical protein